MEQSIANDNAHNTHRRQREKENTLTLRLVTFTLVCDFCVFILIHCCFYFSSSFQYLSWSNLKLFTLSFLKTIIKRLELNWNIACYNQQYRRKKKQIKCKKNSGYSFYRHFVTGKGIWIWKSKFVWQKVCYSATEANSCIIVSNGLGWFL